MRKRVIAVIGAAEPSQQELTLAERTGELIARCDFALVTGGLGGVMEAAARGAARAGGVVIGILPHADPDTCNAHVGFAIATGLGDARNAIIANTADGFVAIGGSFGTLSEIAFALKRHKPVVALSTWKLDESRITREPWLAAETPEQAIDVLCDYLGCGSQAGA